MIVCHSAVIEHIEMFEMANVSTHDDKYKITFIIRTGLVTLK